MKKYRYKSKIDERAYLKRSVAQRITLSKISLECIFELMHAFSYKQQFNKQHQAEFLLFENYRSYSKAAFTLIYILIFYILIYILIYTFDI